MLSLSVRRVERPRSARTTGRAYWVRAPSLDAGATPSWENFRGAPMHKHLFTEEETMTTRREQDRQPADLFHGSRKPFRSDFGISIESRAHRERAELDAERPTPGLDRKMEWLTADAGRDPKARLSRHRTEPE